MSTTKQTPVCAQCGSANVVGDSASRWSFDTQQWETTTVFDKGHHCDDCDGECSIEWVDYVPPKPRMEWTSIGIRCGWIPRYTDPNQPRLNVHEVIDFNRANGVLSNGH